MEIKTLIENINRLVNTGEWSDEMAVVMSKVIASDTNARVRTRIQRSGVDADGSKFESFSFAKIGAYSQMAGEIRRAKGLQTSIMDFTFTGDMWANTGLSGTDKRKEEVTVTIGGTSSSAKEKQKKNEELMGRPLLDLSPEEYEKTKTQMVDAAVKIIKQKLGLT